MGRCASEFTIERPMNKKTQTQSGATPVMTLNYLIWKPLAAKSTAVFYFSAFEMYMYKSMILYTKIMVFCLTLKNQLYKIMNF